MSKNDLKPLQIGNLSIKYPIIQGGMGVGISRGNLAGAVSLNGGLGIISTAQIGYDEPDFNSNPMTANLNAIHRHIALAKSISNNKPVGVNIMVALRDYAAQVKASIKTGADVIISGAGLPLRLPEYVGDSDCKIAPIVSSSRAAKVILHSWKKNYSRTADFIVIEGPLAGGHLGFKREELDTITPEKYDIEIGDIINVVKEYELEFHIHIPVIIAGGIYTHEDICHALSLGADGVQIASRFVATDECDADIRYKQAYIDCHTEDIGILKSPVGLPGRAIINKFYTKTLTERIPVTKCYGCLSKCNPADTPYCITQALTAAVMGDVENGLIFVGANADRIDKIVSVKELMEELTASNQAGNV